MEPQPPPGACPRCGAAAEPLQEFCLACGERLPSEHDLLSALAARWERLAGPIPGALRPVVLLALPTAVATAVAAASVSSPGPAARGPVTTPPVTVLTVPTASTATAPTTPPRTTATRPATTGAATTRATTPPRPPEVAGWPLRGSGYTVVLASIPLGAGRAAAVARARTARRAGLERVGVLVSSAYGSLHAGYYVVFAGAYRSQTDAQSALPRARARGFRDAYPARIAR